MRNRWSWAAAVLLTFGTAAVAQATTFPGSHRCGSMLVRPGDSTRAVHSRCGDPVSRFSTTDDAGNVIRQQWHYRLRGYSIVLVFEGGELAWIEKRD